jgi:hypothetical protein
VGVESRDLGSSAGAARQARSQGPSGLMRAGMILAAGGAAALAVYNIGKLPSTWGRGIVDLPSGLVAKADSACMMERGNGIYLRRDLSR